MEGGEGKRQRLDEPADAYKFCPKADAKSNEAFEVWWRWWRGWLCVHAPPCVRMLACMHACVHARTHARAHTYTASQA